VRLPVRKDAFLPLRHPLSPAGLTITQYGDIRVLDLDYDAQLSSDHAQALLDCQSALSSGDASEAIQLWKRLVGIADELRPLGASLDLPGVQPAATQLLLPALSWISKAVASFSNYDWRDSIEEGLVEYLRICWQRARETILANTALQKS
jgi:hypothetical protein